MIEWNIMSVQNLNVEENQISVLDHGFVRLVDSMGTDKDIAEAARVSYASNKDKTTSDDRNLIRYLLRHRHTSPFEMVEFKFHCKMPIFVARQWIRHRTASVNEISGRYSRLPGEFYVPKEEHFTKQNPNNKQGGTDDIIKIHDCPNRDDWCEYDLIEPDFWDTWSWGESFSSYQSFLYEQYERLLGTGVRKELARINLPLSLYTEWYWKIDLHNLLHFLKLRLDEHAQFEMREYANAIYSLIKKAVPITCEAFEDYIFGAITLTKPEQKCLEEFFDISFNSIMDDCENDMMCLVSCVRRNIRNKREREEFIEKFKKLLYDKGRALGILERLVKEDNE